MTVTKMLETGLLYIEQWINVGLICSEWMDTMMDAQESSAYRKTASLMISYSRKDKVFRQAAV
jgi:hypothetical protein